MLQFIEDNLVEVLAFSLFFGMFFATATGYVVAQIIFR